METSMQNKKRIRAIQVAHYKKNTIIKLCLGMTEKLPLLGNSFRKHFLKQLEKSKVNEYRNIYNTSLISTILSNLAYSHKYSRSDLVTMQHPSKKACLIILGEQLTLKFANSTINEIQSLKAELRRNGYTSLFNLHSNCLLITNYDPFLNKVSRSL